MAEIENPKSLTLSEQYVLEKEEKADVTKVEKPVIPTPEEKIEEISASDGSEVVTPAAEESTETSPPASVESSGTNIASDEFPEAVSEDNSKTTEPEDSADQDSEETSEIKLETAPADFRFPTTNQSKHCFTRYVEYHRCIAARGEGASECDKFAKYYRALCPGEWVDRWNEQRENGTFPGPL